VDRERLLFQKNRKSNGGFWQVEMDHRISPILTALSRSTFRTKFKLKGKDLAYVHEKGLDTIRQHVVDFITNRIAAASPRNDGKQTPMRGHPVFIAQHATATCCRNCIEKWHKIEKGREITEEEKEYLVKVIMAWMEGQASGVGGQGSGL
jgi:hypothetical protein